MTYKFLLLKDLATSPQYIQCTSTEGIDGHIAGYKMGLFSTLSAKKAFIKIIRKPSYQSMIVCSIWHTHTLSTPPLVGYIVTNGLGISQLLGWVYCDRVIGYIVSTRSLSTVHGIGKWGAFLPAPKICGATSIHISS